MDTQLTFLPVNVALWVTERILLLIACNTVIHELALYTNVAFRSSLAVPWQA